MRDGVLAGDPVMSPRLTQLEIMLGGVPNDQAGRDEWRRTARRLLDYTAVWEVGHSRLQDLPNAGTTDADPGQTEDRRRMRELVDEYRHDRGWAPLQRVRGTQLQVGDRVVMQHGPHELLTYEGADPDSGRNLLRDEDGRIHHHSDGTSRGLWLADGPNRGAERVSVTQLSAGEQVQQHHRRPVSTYRDAEDNGQWLLDDDEERVYHSPGSTSVCRVEQRDTQRAAEPDVELEL